MSAGTYSATIHITVTGNLGQPINVQVTFTITTAGPQLQVSPASLSFNSRVLTPSVQTQSIVLHNSAGGGSINYSASFAGQSTWASVSPATGKTTPNSPAILTVSVNSQGLAVGNYHDVLQITWSGGVADIPFSLLVTSQGAILSVGENGLLFEARQDNGLGLTQSVTVFNLGDSSTAVNWTASLASGADWAVLGSASGTATPGTPASFTVSVGGDVNSLPVGGAYALIKVSDLNAQNSPQYVTAVLAQSKIIGVWRADTTEYVMVKLDQTGDDFEFTNRRAGGELTYKATIGHESQQKIGEVPITTIASWEGSTLVMGIALTVNGTTETRRRASPPRRTEAR